MINRAAVLLRYKTPAVQWINGADPDDDDPPISLETANGDRIVYLIRDENADTQELLDEWINLNYQTLFKNELSGWYTDENLWPKKLDLALFYEWFDIECHTIVEDTVGLPIENE